MDFLVVEDVNIMFVKELIEQMFCFYLWVGQFVGIDGGYKVVGFGLVIVFFDLMVFVIIFVREISLVYVFGCIGQKLCDEVVSLLVMVWFVVFVVVEQFGNVELNCCWDLF